LANFHIYKESRRFYAPVVETGFWAPDDMMQLTPPPGAHGGTGPQCAPNGLLPLAPPPRTDDLAWLAGQDGSRVSRDQVKNYVLAATFHGMDTVAYVDYSRVFSGYRMLDQARIEPRIVA
jgi:hypothetical protein